MNTQGENDESLDCTRSDHKRIDEPIVHEPITNKSIAHESKRAERKSNLSQSANQATSLDSGETADFPSTSSTPEGTNASELDATVDITPSNDDTANFSLGATGEFNVSDLAEDPAATQGFLAESSQSKAPIPGYQLLGELGRGAMGVVYRAKQLRANRIVALKVMLNIDHARPEDMARFSMEAEASAQLQHVGIVQVFDVGNVKDLLYFTQEYVTGGTLASKIAKQMLSHDETACTILAITKAVAYAHSRNIVHRDLKPSNILLTEDGLPKIADFGLARRMEDQSHLTKDGSILGTPSYMAPEQAYGSTHEIGPLSDVYTLGVILYELLAGRTPFKGATVWEVIEQVRRVEPSPPSELQPGIPKDLETISLKCLHKDPDKRYGSAQLLADDIQRYINNEPILARPVARWERLVRLCRRHPGEARLVGLVAGLMLLFSIAAGLAAYKFNADRDKIEKQRDQIAVEKRVSDQRLDLSRKTVSTFVNDAPQMLEGLPLARGVTEDFSGRMEDLLAATSAENADDPAMESSRKWGLLAVELRKGDMALTSAENAAQDPAQASVHLDQAKQHIENAKGLALEVYQGNPRDQAKAAGNLALTISRYAAWETLARRGDPIATRKEAIALRKKAAEIETAEESKGLRISALGREWSNLADYRYQSLASLPDADRKTAAIEGIGFAKTAINNLQEGIAAMAPDEYGRMNAQRDLGLAARLLGSLGIAADDIDAITTGFDLSISTFQSLIQQEPLRVAHRVNLIGFANTYGDYLLVNQKDPAAARSHYVISMQQVRELKKDPMLAKLDSDGWAMGYYRLGLAAVAQKDKGNIKRYFERCAMIQDIALRQKSDLPEAKQNPDTLLDDRAGLMLSQAWAGQVEPAVVTARELVKYFNSGPQSTRDDRGNFLARAAFALGIVSQSESLSGANQKAAQQEAISVLRLAIDAGYRDISYLQGDPDVEPLHSLPEFAEIIAGLSSPTSF